MENISAVSLSPVKTTKKPLGDVSNTYQEWLSNQNKRPNAGKVQPEQMAEAEQKPCCLSAHSLIHYKSFLEQERRGIGDVAVYREWMSANCSGDYWERKRRVVTLREQRKSALESSFQRLAAARETRWEEIYNLQERASYARTEALRLRTYPLSDKYAAYLRQVKRRTIKKPELKIALITKSAIQQESEYLSHVRKAGEAAEEKIQQILERQNARRAEITSLAPVQEQMDNRSRQSSPVSPISKLDQFLNGTLPVPLTEEVVATEQQTESTVETTSPVTPKVSVFSKLSSALGAIFRR
jgi:hypothetical protein